MANNPFVSDTAANAAANAIGALCNGGTVNLYTSPQPANANTAVTTQTLLATLTMGSPAWGAAVAGTINANAISTASAAQTGTAAWARILQSDGITVVMDCSVSTAGADVNLSSTSIVAGTNVAITSLAYTQTE
jgi:hypothetical protein